MVDLYVVGYLALAGAALYVKNNESTAPAFLPQATNLALALGFVCVFFFTKTSLLFLDSLGVWFQWGPAGSLKVASLRGAFALALPALFGFQNSILLSGALTSLIFLTLLAAKPKTILQNAVLATLALVGVSFAFVTTDSLPVFFVSFELLLLLSLYLLRLTSKSERVVEASVEMFFWTLFGSAALLVAFVQLFAKGLLSFHSLEEAVAPSALTAALFVVGFGVKVPLWPFFSWLLKAHVEASVEFSILLSGFIVKLGVFGLYKALYTFSATWAPHVLFGFSLLGLCFATARLFSQRDLKRIVALTTVVEMNWLGLCLALGGSTFNALASYIVVVHSITTALEFSTVEVISKRYGTRDVGRVAGLFASTPSLATVSFLVILTTIGFPGTPLFTAKFLFFAQLCPLSWALACLVGFLLLLALPLYFMRLWAPLWFGLGAPSATSYDLSSGELLLFASLLTAASLLALCPQTLLAL